MDFLRYAPSSNNFLIPKYADSKIFLSQWLGLVIPLLSGKIDHRATRIGIPVSESPQGPTLRCRKPWRCPVWRWPRGTNTCNTWWDSELGMGWFVWKWLCKPRKTQWFCWSDNPVSKWLFHWGYTTFSDIPMGWLFSMIMRGGHFKGVKRVLGRFCLSWQPLFGGLGSYCFGSGLVKSLFAGLWMVDMDPRASPSGGLDLNTKLGVS